MSFKNLISFGAGEITPELAERGNLEKFRTGLKTLRNTFVTKMGGLKNRAGTTRAAVGIENYQTRYHTIPNKPFLFEFKTDRLLIFTTFNNQTYSFNTLPDVVYVYYPFEAVGEARTFTQAELKILNFTSDDKNLYIFCKGKRTLKLLLTPPYTMSVVIDYKFDFSPFYLASPTTDYTAGGWTAPTGYEVDYTATYVQDGVESFTIGIAVSGLPIKLPNGINQANNVLLAIPDTIPPDYLVQTGRPEEVRFYRRPRGAGAWGFIGSASSTISASGSPPPAFYYTYKIIDFGQDADYTNQPPAYVTGLNKDTGVDSPFADSYATNFPHTGLIYQNRLMIAGVKSKGSVFGSRTDAPEVFLRDFPLQDDSAVSLKTGSDGGANVGRFYDGRGLIITTNVGVYETPADILKPDTAYAIKRSNVVHDSLLQVIGMGTSFFLWDKRMSGVFSMTPSGENNDYQQNEISIFSAHMFEGKKIVSWTIQDDNGQIVWMALDDGSLVSLSYQQDQQLQAWARHDTDGEVLQVMTLKQADQKDILLMSVRRTNTGLGTLISAECLTNRNVDFIDYVGSDAAVIYKTQMIPDGERVTIIPVALGDWTEVNMTYSGPTDLWSDTPGNGAIGSVFRFFNEETRQNVDYQVKAIGPYMGLPMIAITCDLISDLSPDIALDTIDDPIVVTEMYKTWNTFGGLYPLEGKKVSVRVDGFTHASPLNTDPEKNYPVYTVTGGKITLNDGERGAIVSIGLPYTSDIQTLDVDTIEQSPVKLESQLVNKIHISYYNSRGLYAKSDYPNDDTVTGMENHETQTEPDAGILPMQPPMPYTSREEMIIQGDWACHGSIALRNVDPQPIGVRAIILDEEILTGG